MIRSDQIGTDHQEAGSYPLCRLSSPTRAKTALRDATDAALAAGVFGVPTFACKGELFWGFDRMPQLAELLQGRREPINDIELEKMLGRPRGVDRRSKA